MHMLPKVQRGIFMVNWTARENEILRQYSGKKFDTVLREIPETERKWKCHSCHTILNNSDLIDKKCPVCGEVHLQQMCPMDHNGCQHDIVGTIELCPICKQVLCPVCGCHDVAAVSRVTGYLSNVEGWNNSKRAELKDRVRSNLSHDGEMIRV